MKKLVTILTLALIITLTACDTKSTSNDKCPANEYGNHDWVSATCVKPTHCSNCGLYKDENLANYHNWDTDDSGLIKCNNCSILRDDWLLQQGEQTHDTTENNSSVNSQIDSSQSNLMTEDNLNTATESNVPTDTNCAHSFSKATCTESSICTKCGKFNSNALGHDWGNPTCTTSRSCLVCFAVDPYSEPLGHDYVQGECTICGEDDPTYTEVNLTSTTYNVYLEDENYTAYITMIGGETIEYDIDDTSIVTCEWGDWDGDTIPLTFKPNSSGETYVIVSAKGYNESITIYITVNNPTPEDLTTLTIEGVGEELKQYNTGLPNTNKLHSATYRIGNYPNDTVAIWVDFIVSCTDCVDYNGYISLRYNLYNSSGVVYKTGTTLTAFTHTDTQYAGELVFSDLPPDDYKLVFSSKY